jgi:ubiquitin C-terminal hydrolase
MSTAVLSPLNMMELNCFTDEDIDFSNTNSPLVNIQCSDSLPSTDDSSSTSVPSLADDNDIEMEDVEAILAHSRDGVVVSQSYGGLRNLGNTCYMNSGLQMLASLNTFTACLEESPPEQDEEQLLLRQEYVNLMKKLQSGQTVHPEAFKKVMDTRSPLFIGYRQQDCHEFTTALLDLLGEDYAKKDYEDGRKDDSGDMREEPECSDSTADSACCSSLSLSIQRLHPFSALELDDISKLLHGNDKTEEKAVLCKETSLEQPLCKLVGGRAVASLDDPAVGTIGEASSPSTDISVNDDTHATRDEHRQASPIEEYFATEIRARLTCDSCKYSRSHLETFLCLSLDIGTDSGSVEDGLRKFFAPEKRDIKCEKCFSEVGATSTMEITKLPRAMLFHFKRFIVDVSPDYSSITYRKNQSQVDFSERLSLHECHGVLSEFLAADVTIPESRISRVMPRDGDDDSMGDEDVRSYEIRSVVNHIGSSASCGHYTADASRLYPNGERKWTRFNDAIVSTLNKDDAMGPCAKTTAYMVMYELE